MLAYEWNSSEEFALNVYDIGYAVDDKILYDWCFELGLNFEIYVFPM